MSHQNEKKESNPGYQRQFEPGKMGFLWLFYGFSTSRSKKPPNLTLRLTSSCHPVLTKQLDVTLLKNKSDETRNNEHSFFVLKTKLLKNGEAPVLMRITINGDYDDARIQRSVPLNLWNAAKGCSKGRDRASVALNTYIAELHARALEKHKELVLEQALITPKLILKRVFGKDTGMRTLLGTMQEGIEEMESLVNIDYSPVTINRYKNVVKKLRQLIPSYYGKEDITFHELTPEFIRAFDIYLKTEGGLCRNTIVRYMKCFKKFTNMALAKEWMRKNPFYGYKMEQDETDPVFLTYDELQAVIKKKFAVPRLELVRDIFVFACFTGLAFSDVAGLNNENLVQDNLGDWWIRKGRVKLERRRKASSISNIPLLPVPLAILENTGNTRSA